MKVAIIFGTRPEIIKMAPVIRACQDLGVDRVTIHTGQHYSVELDGLFFSDLNVPAPDYNVQIGSGTHGVSTAKALVGIEEILMKRRPDVVLVQGDTNSVLAGALAACKIHVKVGHLEAGLRSRDKRMPEEINRTIVDHMSDFLFAPTVKARENLLAEGIDAASVFVTGNTVVDALCQHLELAREKARCLRNLRLSPKGYMLLTLHREENVDVPKRFRDILLGLKLVHDRAQIPIVYPIHPRSERRLREHGLQIPEGVVVTKPVGYIDFLQMQENARLILTDSGGIQEEACILGVPCVTLRDNTERPETIEVGANVVAGCVPEAIANAAELMMSSGATWANPFGDGRTGERIVRLLEEHL